jgi:AraC-like DNA-binding protein
MTRKIQISENQHHRFPFFIYKSGNIGIIPEHSHDFFEIVYIYKGNGVCRIGGRSYPFKSGQLIFTPEDIPHYFESHRGSLHRQVSIAVHRDILSGISLKWFDPEAVLDEIISKRDYIVSVPAEDIREVEETIENLYQSLLFKPRDWMGLISLELPHLLILIGRFLAREVKGVPAVRCEDLRICRTLRQFETDYFSSACLDDTFKMLTMNRRYFIRLFKKYTGHPPLNYLNRLRIEKACELLAGTSHPVIQIAYDVGFTDLTHFNRLFKKFLGVPPSRFRSNLTGRDRDKPLPGRFHFPLSHA